MKTQKYILSAQGDAEYDHDCPISILVDIESATREAKKMHNALILANCISIQSYHSYVIAEYDESDKETDSSYEYGMTVSSDGSIGITGQNKHNGAASVFVSLDFKIKDSKGEVTYTLKDGDNLKRIHVAVNGNFGNDDTILIWEENTFGGASDAPIAIVNNGGKLEIRYWQPEDMGCDPTSVVAIKPYGIYDIQLESGVELDEFDMSIIQNDCQTVATAKMEEDGETYDIKAYVINILEGNFGFDIFRHGELVRSSDVTAKYWSVRDCFFALLNKVIEQPDCLPDADQKVYCESCKMDVAFDEIGNCMNCGMPVDDWNQLEENGEVPFILEGVQRGGVRIVGTIEEGCPHCDTTVELKDEFHAQACPECGEMILPCNICPHMDSDNYNPNMCTTCPIEHTKISNQKEEV